MTIINACFHVSNDTFAWIVAQILAAETARQQTQNAAPSEKERPHV